MQLPIPSRSRKNVRKNLGVYILILAVVVCIATTFTFALGFNHRTLHSFPVPVRLTYLPGPDPVTAAEQGLMPTSTTLHPITLPTTQTIEIRPKRIDLLVGDKVVKSIPQTVTALQSLVQAVDDPKWVSGTNGVIQLNAAVILEPQTTLTIAAPTTHEVRLLDVPNVVIGARSATLIIQGVTITSWHATKAHTTNEPHPSVVANFGSTMNIVNSTFTGLGWDWNGSYGVSWMNQSTGHAIGSTFDSNFIGAYTAQARGITFDHDTFQNNLLYGLDPHSFSQKLIVKRVTAQNNRGNGIIFSNHVTDSLIQDSISRNNGENGIMMDATSTGNTIRNNEIAYNAGDGMVTSNSPANRIVGNAIHDNRVGIHVSGPYAVSEIVTGNKVLNNALAVQGIALPPDNVSQGNGGQWLPDAVVRIWEIATGILILLVLLTWLLRSYNERR